MSKRTQGIWDKIEKLNASTRQAVKQLEYGITEKRFAMTEPNQEVLDVYRDLRKNIGNTEISVPRPKVAYQYVPADVRNFTRPQI